MRILANILRSFKVSSRESCKISNRRYSSQICPRIRGSLLNGDSPTLNVICVRSITTTPVNRKADTIKNDSTDKKSTNQIIPVALLKNDSSTKDANPLKVLVIPINLFSNDEEAVQKTMTTLSVLRDNADQLGAFTDNVSAFSKKNYFANKESNNPFTNVLGRQNRRFDEPLWQEFEIEADSAQYLDDNLDEALAEHDINRLQSRNSFDTIDWNDSKRFIFTEVPQSLEKSLDEAGIASMNLAFEMDMTNIKDALMMREKSSSKTAASTATVYNEFDEPASYGLKDPTLALTTCFESESTNSASMVPLNFNALIQGTVNIDSSKLTPEQLEDMKIPQFNDYVTTMAANICSNALQKGFPSDLNRMYSTKSAADPPKKPKSPNIICERQGDKGCISPGNAGLDPYVSKSSRGSDTSGGMSRKEPGNLEECKAENGTKQEASLLSSAIMGDSGARGLMSCKAYAMALKEAARLRELIAAEKEKKDCAPNKDDDACGRKKPKKGDTCPTIPCGPPKQDSICKDKDIKIPPPKPPQNDPCSPQDAPCKRADSGAPASAPSVQCTSGTANAEQLKLANDEPPCKKLPYICPTPKKKDKDETKEWESNPCRINYPKNCPPKTSVGDCKRPIIDPCAPQGTCNKKEDKKPPPKCPPHDPCKKKADSAEAVKIEEPPKCFAAKDAKTHSLCAEAKQTGAQQDAPLKCSGEKSDPCSDAAKGSEKPPAKAEAKIADAKECAKPTMPSTPNCSKSTKCDETKKAEPSKCGETKKAEPPKCGGEAKKAETPKCGDSKKAEPPKCGCEDKKAEPAKCGCEDKKAESPKCGGEAKKAEPSKCGGEAKKAEPSKCGGEAKKAEPSKCGESKKAEPPKCGGEAKKAEPPKCGGEAKKAEPPKCGGEAKKAEPPKCGGEAKKAEPPKCGGEAKKAEPPKCGGEAKKAEPPKCGGEAKKAEPPKCGGEAKKAEPSKCGESKKAEPPKCGGEAEKAEPPKCGGEAKKAEPPKCGETKKAEPPKCGDAKKAEPPKCGDAKKAEPPKCGGESKKAEPKKCESRQIEPSKSGSEPPKCGPPKFFDPRLAGQQIVQAKKLGPPKFYEASKCGAGSAAKKAESPKSGDVKKALTFTCNEPPCSAPGNPEKSSPCTEARQFGTKALSKLKVFAPEGDQCAITSCPTTKKVRKLEKGEFTAQPGGPCTGVTFNPCSKSASQSAIKKSGSAETLFTATCGSNPVFKASQGSADCAKKASSSTNVRAEKDVFKAHEGTVNECKKNETKKGTGERGGPCVDARKFGSQALTKSKSSSAIQSKNAAQPKFQVFAPQSEQCDRFKNKQTTVENPKHAGMKIKDVNACTNTPIALSDLCKPHMQAKKDSPSSGTKSVGKDKGSKGDKDGPTRCANSAEMPMQSTKPNCPNRSNATDKKQPRCYSTFCRQPFASAFSSFAAVLPFSQIKWKVDSSPLSTPFSSKNDGKKNDVDCPAGPPRPPKRVDKAARTKLKDCFAQDRLDNPCHKASLKTNSCEKKPEPKKCWEKLEEKKNKYWQRHSTLLLISRKPAPKMRLFYATQHRQFSASATTTQYEKHKINELQQYDENEAQKVRPKPKLPQLSKKLPKNSKETGNEIIRIGGAGEVLRIPESIENITDYDVLLRVAAIAISGSDIHVYETGGDKCLGITIGHDATGIVEKVGKCVDRLKPGDCVAMESGLCCGICDVCKQGSYHLCSQLFYNGFFSAYQTHPADLCHKIPDSVTLEDAALTSILALGCQACFKAHITPTSNVLIMGTCPKACAAALCARALGAKSVAILAPNVYTLESVRILFDVDYVHYYENESNLMQKVTERVCAVLKNRPNVIINYAINPTTMNMAINLLKPGGSCVLAECDQEHASFNAMDVLMKSISLITSFRSANMFPTALNLMRTGRTPIGELVSRIYTWDQVKWAFHWAQYEANMGNRKVIVQGPELS